MRVQEFSLDGNNTGKLKPAYGWETSKTENSIIQNRVDENFIEIERHRFTLRDDVHPLRTGDKLHFRRNYFLKYENRITYIFSRFGQEEKNMGIHIVAFTWFQHQQFLFMQSQHWLQKEENIRYIVNILFLILGVLIGLIGL